MNGLIQQRNNGDTSSPNAHNGYFNNNNNNSMFNGNPTYINPSSMSSGNGNAGMGMGINGNGAGQGSYQMPGNGNPNPYQQQQGFNNQWQQGGAGGGGMNYSMDPSSSSSSQSTSNQAYFNPAQLSSNGNQTFGNYNAQNLNPFGNQQVNLSNVGSGNGNGGSGGPPPSSSSNPNGSIDPSTLFRMQQQQNQGFQNGGGGGGSANGMIGGGIGGGTMNPNSPFAPPPPKQGQGWDPNGGMTGNGGQYGNPSQFQQQQQQQQQQRFQNPQHFQPQSGNNSMSPMMNQSPRPGSQPSYQQPHQRRPSEAANTSSSMAGLDNRGKREDEPTRTQQGSGAVPSQARPSAVAMPGISDIQEVYLANAKAQAGTQIKALQSAKPGLNATDTAMSVGLIPIPNCQGAFWIPVISTKDQQSHLSNASAQAKLAAQSPDPSVKQAASPANMLQSRGLVYVPVTSLPPGVKPSIARPDNPTQGGTVMSLGDARMLGLGPFQGKMNEQIHQIQLVSGLVRSYQSQAAQQKFQQQQQQHQQMPHGSPPSQAFPSPHQVQSQGHGFSSPAPGTMLPPQSPAIPLHQQQQQQLDRKPLGSNPLHMNAMSAAVAAGGGAPPMTSNQPLAPAAQSIQPPPAIAPSSANPSSSISPSTANLYNPSMFAAIGTSAIAASKDKLPLPGLEDGGDESSRSKLDNQNRASIQSLQKSNATGSNFGLKLFNNRLKKKSDSDPSSSTKKEKEEEAGTDLLGDGLGPNLFAQGILPPEVGFNPDQALVNNRTQLVTSVSTFNVQEANKIATSIANHPPKDEDGNDLTPVRGGLLPSQSNAGNRITAYNTSRRVLPTDNRNSREEAAWKEMSETESKELERIIKKDVEYQKIVEDQFDKTNGFLKGKARELWPVDRSWEDIARNNKGKARVEERANGMDVDSKPPPKKKSRLHWWEKNEFEDLFNPHHSRSSDNFESFRIIFPSEKRKNGIQELNNSIKEGNGPISNRALGVLNLSTNPVVMSSSFSTLLVDKEKELEQLKERERLREKEKERERERESKENGSNTIVEISNVNHDYNSKEQVKDEREEDLIPIRLELDIDGWRLRDTFTWSTSNCTDPTKFNKEHEDSTTIKPEIFAQSLCDELGFPSNVFIGPIKEAIQSQISEHLATRALIPSHLGWEEEDSSNRGLHSGRGKLEGGDLKWWKNWRDEMDRKNQILEKVDNETGDFLMEVEEGWSGNVKKRKRIDEKDPTADVIEIEDDEVILLGTDGAPKKLNLEDLRILVKLDITVGAMNLVDQFEWDLSDPRNCAEDFAETFASDLGLAGEFRTAIAHSIREQAAVHFASLAIVGYPFDGSAVQDEELRSAFLPTISSDSRLTRSKNEAESFTPRLVELTESEIDKLDKERERELRRKKRQTRGRRAINLPDREPLKSSRTSAVWGLQNGNLEGATGISGVGGDLRVSTRRAAAAAIDKINAATVADRGGSPGPDGIYTFNSASVSAPASGGNNTPTPAPPVKQPKKPRYQNYAASFTYPGGLGTTQEDLGPRFTSGPVADEKKEPTAVATATVAQVVVPTSGSAAQASGAPVLGLSKAERAQRDLDLQHPNLHDGQWHCSNCGIPASLVPSTRKGPLGPNTLCAVCGKYYHRFRRMRETTYSRDIAFHKKNYNKTSSDADVNGVGRVASQNSNAGPSVPTQNQSTVKGGKSTTVDPDPDYQEDESMDIRGQSPDLPFLQVGSPEDSASSRSNSPVSNRSASPVKRSIKLVSKSPASQPVPLPQASASASSPQPASKAPLPNGSVAPANAASPPPPPPVNPPQWLTDAADTLRRTYPKDKFDLAVRKYPAGTPAPPVPEWRIKCLDCPGKLYTPGPAETLDNFTLHLKNRKHRQAVQDRLNGVISTASPSAAANSPKTANQSIASTSNAK